MSDMLPYLAPFDAANNRMKNTVVYGNAPIRPAVAADGVNLFFGKLRAAVTCAARRPFWLRVSPVSISTGLAAFGYHIGAILGVSPTPKVARIAARRIVATMEPVQLERVASINRHANTVRHILTVVNDKLAVSFGQATSRPRPALIRPAHVNLSPKSGYIARGHFWYRFSHRSRSLRSVTAAVLKHAPPTFYRAQPRFRQGAA